MMRRCLATLILLACATDFSAQTHAIEEKPLFDAERATLYTQDDLTGGFDPAKNSLGWDAEVYRQYIRTGKFYPPRAMSRAESLHDDGISAALRDYVLASGKRNQLIVAVMGNAREDERCTMAYRQTVQLGYDLAKAGYLVSTGGGPGEMEAANLGAYLSAQPPAALDEAIAIMRRRARRSADPAACTYASNLESMQAAFDVLKRFPKGTESLGVPTWFYGHEPPNAFATRIAKYFSNALREEALLVAATGGVIYTEGRAGMRQEIFQRASMNDFASFCTVVPMVFLGSKEFTALGLYQLVYDYAEPAFPPVGSYRGSLKLTDSVAEAVGFIKATPPRHVDDAEGACKRIP